MAMPYKVEVRSNGKDDIKVKIEPQPITTKEQYNILVTGRFTKILTNQEVRNTIIGRNRLKKELEEALQDFHEQGLIAPKEKDEGERSVQ